eukprot:3021869-Pyramimonas_sp.AAC.1
MGPPHGIRHAAAADFVAAGGGLEEARRRGRWKTPSALSRYTKVHTLIRRRSQLPSTTMETGRSFW